MSNERERLARQWAENFKADILYDATMDELAAASEHILATTTEPTMADVEWDDEKHYLAGAVYELDEHTCPVVMVGETRDGCEIYSVDLDENTGFWPMHGDLTPNGKRYELREVSDEHPEMLRTVKDYENAPVGTIAAVDFFLPLVKLSRDIWASSMGDHYSNEGIAGVRRKVLRWGWGE